jgi:hypothetical protein
MADFNHIDYTAELNRIILALTGIRDDVRLLQTLQSDPESGIVTSNVLNDFQRALLAVSMSTAQGNTAAAVASAIDSGASTNGGGTAAATGDSAGDLDAERTSILTALGQDSATQKILIRSASGQYYWEAAGTAGPDDGLRGSTTQVTPFALGEQLGYDNLSTGAITQGAPTGPPNIPDPSKPKKRWPFTRVEGTTASQSGNPNADLVDPATGEVVASTPEAQQAADKLGGAPAPIVTSTDQAFGIFQNPNATEAQRTAAQAYVAANP